MEWRQGDLKSSEPYPITRKERKEALSYLEVSTSNHPEANPLPFTSPTHTPYSLFSAFSLTPATLQELTWMCALQTMVTVTTCPGNMPAYSTMR